MKASVTLNIKTISNIFYKKRIETIADPNAKEVFVNLIGYQFVCGMITVIFCISYLTVAFINDLNNVEMTAFVLCALYPIFMVPMVVIDRKAGKASLVCDDSSIEEIITKAQFKNKLAILLLVILSVTIIAMSILC